MEKGEEKAEMEGVANEQTPPTPDDVSEEMAGKIEEVDCPIEAVKMAEGEELRVVVSKMSDGAMGLAVKTKGDVQDVSFFEVVGLLTVAQNDLMLQNQPPQQQAAPMADIVLEKEDFELDPDGQLTAAGKKVGDVLKVPAPIAELRKQSIEAHKRRKGEPTHMSVVTEEKEDTKE